MIEQEPSTGKEAAIEYYEKGWHPIGLPHRAKEPPPNDYTGGIDRDMTLEEIEALEWSGNVGTRMPEDVIGLDVDAYNGGKDTLDDLIDRCGPLPPTWISHNGRNDGSGIRYFRVPVGMTWIAGRGGIDIIQRTHRYGAVWPSIHPEDRLYEWWDQAEAAPSGIPLVEDLPELPWTWIGELSRATQGDIYARSTAADRAGVVAFLTANDAGEAPSYLTAILDHFKDRWQQNYSRHDTMQHCLIWAMEMSRAQVINAQDAVTELGQVWVAALVTNRRRQELESDRRTTEFEAMLRHAVGKAAAKPQAVIDKLHDDYAGIRMNPGPAPSTEPPTEPAVDPVIDAYQAGAMDGASFILDQPTDLVARWGQGANVLWAQGESLLLVGPSGVGKTTLAGQLVGALIGALPTVLGYPVARAKRVLYLAMDRPRQIARAFGRLFGPAHRQALIDHLVVRRGPLPYDVATKPEILLELAKLFEADVLVIDSLKDAAVQLTDDRVAGNINRAIQFCNVADIDVLVLHHQRKSIEGKKPTSLEDVYGSTWVAAGAGSVVLLWGDPGSEQVELTHLKQPAEVIGPLSIEHDHHAGTSSVVLGWDALVWLRGKGAIGGTVNEAAQAHHGGASPPKAGSAKWKATERRLRSLVRDGLATTTGRPQVGVPGRYFAAIAPTISPPTSHGQVNGQGVFDRSMDEAMDNPLDTDLFSDKTAGQSMDSPMDKE